MSGDCRLMCKVQNLVTGETRDLHVAQMRSYADVLKILSQKCETYLRWGRIKRNIRWPQYVLKELKKLKLKAVVNFEHPRIPAFQPFMKPVSYFLRKQFHAVQCLYQL